MKDIDYTGLRRLAKYDIGTLPIGSGYLRNPNQTLAGYFTQNMTPVTNAFVPQATSAAINSVLPITSNIAGNYMQAHSALSAVGTAAAKETAAKLTPKLAAIPGLNVSTQAMVGTSKTVASELGNQLGKTAGKAAVNEAGKKSVASLLGSAATTASVATNALGALQGISGIVQNMKDSDTLSSGDLSNMSSRTTEYTNGVAYERMGGYDESGVNSYVDAQNKANKISGVSSGLAAGAGIGGIIGTFLPGGPLTGLLGAGIGGILGALGGGLFGGHARRKRERAIEEAKRQYALAADAYNTQNESEAASTGLRNDFYATHADAGKDIISTKRYDSGKPNSLVGPDEIVGRVDKNGNIIKAFRVQGGPGDVHGHDTIPAKLGDRDFVIGNKINPFTGNEYSAEGAIFANMFNNGDPAGELGLKTLLDMLKHTKRNNPNTDMSKYNCGKSPHKYAIGKNLSGAFIPTMAFAANELDNWSRKKEVDRMPVEAFNAYSPNPYLMQAGALMPTQYNIDPLMLALNDEARFANYAINQSAYSPGQKMAMLSNLYNKKMLNITRLLGEKANQENAMRANYAKWLSEVGAQEQQLSSAYRQKYYDQLAQAVARKFNAKEQVRKDKRQNWNDFALNLYNIYMGNKNIGLYEQLLSNELKKIVQNAGNNIGYLSTGSFVLPSLSWKPYQSKYFNIGG